MRWLLALLVAAAGVALGGAGLLLLDEEDPEDRLPDLRTAVPRGLEIVQVGDTYRLVFASAVTNVGRGPLLVEAEREGRTAETLTARQLVRRSDGSSRERDVPVELAFAGPEADRRWRLPGFMRYELRRAEDGTVVERDRKAGFCLADGFEADAATDAENEPVRPVWTEVCGRGRAGLLVVRQGISPGFGSRYDPELEGQYVDVTTVPAGRYVLVHRVDPDRALEESDHGNNAASVLVQLRRTAGAIPAVRVLARCPGAESCRRD